MDIAVCLKQVADPFSIEIDYLTGRVESSRVVQITNPPDLCALEAALRLKEQFGGTVTVISIGSQEVEGSLKQAAALGADRVLRIWESDWENIDAPDLTAFALALFIKKRPFDLVLCGDGGGYFQASRVTPWIAEFLQLPLVSGIVELSGDNGGKTITVKRRLEKGKRQVLKCELPVILAVTQFLNELRECPLPDLLTALAAPVPVADLPLGTVARMIPQKCSLALTAQTIVSAPNSQGIFTPDPSLTAQERINSLLSGGTSVKRTEVVQGSPIEAAAKIVEFLQTNNIISDGKI